MNDPRVLKEITQTNKLLAKLISLLTPRSALAIDFTKLSAQAQIDLKYAGRTPGAIIRCTDADLKIFRNQEAVDLTQFTTPKPIPKFDEPPMHDPAVDTSAPSPAPLNQLDCTGLTCPLPVLRLKKALALMDIGDMIEFITTDPDSHKNVRVMLKQTGNKLIDSNEEFHTDRIVFLLEKR